MSSSAEDDVTENKQNNEDTIRKNTKSDNKINSINIKTTTGNHENIIETASTFEAEGNTESKILKQEHSPNLNETNSESVYSACSINVEAIIENNTGENSKNGNLQRNISNFERTINNGIASNNAAEEDLFTSNSEEQENKMNSDEEHGKLETVKDCATFLFFLFYLSDIVTDMSLSLKFFSAGEVFNGCYILFFIYASSLVTTVIERKKHNKKLFCSFVILFILNLTGVILYIEIIQILYRKIRKKTYDVNLLYLKQETLKVLKVAEALHEALPQLILQSILISELHITWLQYASVMTSGLGIIVTLGVCLSDCSQDIPNISVFGKVIKWFWQMFDAVFSFTLLISFIMIILNAGGIAIISRIINIIFIAMCLRNIFAFNIISHYERYMTTFIKICSTYDTFELKYLHTRKAIIKRIVLTITAILIITSLYYTGSSIRFELLFMYECIHYAGIVCIILGLLVIILIVVQICRIPKVKRTDNIISYLFSY